MLKTVWGSAFWYISRVNAKWLNELTTNCHRGTDHTDCGQQLGRGMKIQIICNTKRFVVILSFHSECCNIVMKSVSLSVQVFCCVLLFVMKAVSLSVQVFCCVLLQQATPHFRCFAVLMNFLVTLTAWTLVMVKCSFLQPLSQTFCLSWSYCSYVNEFYGQPALYLTWFFYVECCC